MASGSKVASSEGDTMTTPKLRILVIEPETSCAEQLRTMLADRVFADVVVAPTADDACAALRRAGGQPVEVARPLRSRAAADYSAGDEGLRGRSRRCRTPQPVRPFDAETAGATRVLLRPRHARHPHWRDAQRGAQKEEPAETAAGASA